MTIKPMLIAQTGNIFPFGPSKAYGGERIVGYLCRALRDRGHRVVFFGTPQHELTPGIEHVHVPHLDTVGHDPHPEAIRAWENENGAKFDVVQCNYFGGKFDQSITRDWPYVELVWCNWAHGRDQMGRDFNAVSYSKRLQDTMKAHGRESTRIYYGIPFEDYQVGERRTDQPYVVWIGKMEGGKGCFWAIDVATKAGYDIYLMGPPYNSNEFQSLLPRLAQSNVRWLRGCSDRVKAKIFAGATAFLSTNADGWAEDFGIVNIEAMACGCPVLGWTRVMPNVQSAVLYDGVIDEGDNGYLIRYETSEKRDDATHRAVSLLKGPIPSMDRHKVRATVERRFNADLMARRFEWFYEQVQDRQPHARLEVPF